MRYSLPCVLVFAVFAVAGCEAPPGDPDLDPEPPAEAEPAAPPAEVPAMTEAEIDLAEVNDSGVSGDATAIHQNGAVTILLELEGFPEEGEYAAHIHAGTCEAGGPVAEGLNPVLALADGTGSSTTIVEADELEDHDALFIQVHGEGGAPIACGDIEEHPWEG